MLDGRPDVRSIVWPSVTGNCSYCKAFKGSTIKELQIDVNDCNCGVECHVVLTENDEVSDMIVNVFTANVDLMAASAEVLALDWQS
uniref:Uncharacterized protein n=1 Tax=Nelumbo nucifera TaxID=4432 RepID=A0A822Y6Z7_NELNU|nr:TPA_asm: hypothetical protein HUJ06_028849 [Nelumbo nucifera]